MVSSSEVLFSLHEARFGSFSEKAGSEVGRGSLGAERGREREESMRGKEGLGTN